MKKDLLLLVFLFASGLAFSQQEETLFGNNGLPFSGIWGGWSNTFSSIKSENVYFTGGYGALEFGRRFYIGYAGERLVNDSDFDAFETQEFDMNYGGLLLGYAHLSHKVVHPRFSMLLGRGKIEYVDDEGSVSDPFFTVQPGLGLELNIFKWVKLGLNGGYRFVMDVETERVSDRDLSSVFGSVSLNFGLIWGRS
jgi:hypothetical protein